MKKRRLFSLLLAAAMSLALVSCGNGGDTSGNGTADGGNASQVDADGDGYKDAVKLAISTDPNLDPWLTGMAYDLNVGRQIYDPLFREGENGEVEPWLAEGYEMVDDTHIKLTLRKGVKFHDGNELTTKDVKFFLDNIESNASAASRFVCYDTANTEIIDDYNMVVALKYPYAEGVYLMTRMYIPSSAAFESMGADKFATAHVGTGPYKMTRWDTASEIELDRFDEYWNGPAATPKLLFRVIPEASSRMIELETGGVDFAYSISTSDYDRVKETEGLTLVEGDSSLFTSLTFSMQEPLFENKDVRYALCYAIDKQFLIDTCYGGYYTIMDTIYPKMLFGAEEVGTVPFDPDKAKELMVQAGYPDGFDITLHVVGEAEKRVCEAIQSMWLQYLNVRAEIIQMDYVNFEAAGNKYQAAVRTGAATNLTSALVIYKTSFGRTLQVNDQYLNDLVEASDQQTDPAKRLEMVQEIQEYVYDQRYQMAIANAPMVYAMNDKAEGFEFDIFGAPFLATFRVGV